MAIASSDTRKIPAYPLWITAPYTGFVVVLVPIYSRQHGPTNFLWFSDIAVFAVLISLWTGRRLPYSMMAVGVLPLELAWVADFFSGGRLIGLAAYMFDRQEPLHLRLLSSFHLFMPPLIILMLVRQGYDRSAFRAQTLFAWTVLAATRLLTKPKKNINWVHGFGPGPDVDMPVPPLLHLALYMGLLPEVALLPAHLVMKRIFKPSRPRG